MAARYVHQMADEVLIQLESLNGSAAAASATKPAVSSSTMSSKMEELLREWNDNFPPSLGSIGSPKAVAARVASLTKEVSSLNEAIKTSKVTHEAVFADLQNQLKLSRSGILLERQHLADEMNRKEAQMEEHMKQELKRCEELLRVAEQSAKDKLKRVERELGAKVSAVAQDKAKLQALVDKLTVENQRQAEKRQVKSRAIRELESSMSVGTKVKHEHVEILQDLVRDEDDEELEVAALRFDDDERNIPESTGAMENANILAPRRRTSIRSVRSMEDIVSTRLYEDLQRKLAHLESRVQEQEQQVQTMDIANTSHLEHIEFLKNRCASLEDMNSNLRDALAHKAVIADSTSLIRKYTPKALAHIPDFLQKADRSTFLD